MAEDTGRIPQEKQAEPSHNGPLMKAGIATIAAFCICSKCPTYPDQKDPKVYCARGASPLPIEIKGCLCPDCPVQKTLRLKRMNYCYYGSNRQLKKEES